MTEDDVENPSFPPFEMQVTRSITAGRKKREKIILMVSHHDCCALIPPHLIHCLSQVLHPSVHPSRQCRRTVKQDLTPSRRFHQVFDRTCHGGTQRLSLSCPKPEEKIGKKKKNWGKKIEINLHSCPIKFPSRLLRASASSSIFYI